MTLTIDLRLDRIKIYLAFFSVAYEDLVDDSVPFKESKLGLAFARLRTEGIRACMNIGESHADGEDLITGSGSYHGDYVFFTGLTHSAFARGETGYLDYGSLSLHVSQDATLVKARQELATKITAALEDEGIKIEAIEASRILVDLGYCYKHFLSFIELILVDRDEASANEQLVMMVIADYIQDGSDEELSEYGEMDEDDRAHIIWQFNIWMHSGLDDFTEYFRGYYSTPDNGFHDEYLEDGSTDLELYRFLDTLDWSLIYEACRRHCDLETISKRFNSVTGFCYQRERLTYPPQVWDGKPRWKMSEGRYLPSD